MTIKEYFSVKGRMRRKHYIPIYLAFLGVVVFIGMLQAVLEVQLGILMYFAVAALIPPSVRRLHDIGYSGWLLLILPLAVLVMLAAPGEQGANVYGTNPKPTVC
jgi:uncharacterized membrane protein YhaH (DUF805 family)